MVLVIAWENIPGHNNLELAQKMLKSNGIDSTGRMTGMSFDNIPPISLNIILVDEKDGEAAKALLGVLDATGWMISRQSMPEKGGTDDNGESGETD